MLRNSKNPELLLQMICLITAVTLIVLTTLNITIQTQLPLQAIVPILVGNAIAILVVASVWYITSNILLFHIKKGTGNGSKSSQTATVILKNGSATIVQSI